jgi:hypothetical protein
MAFVTINTPGICGTRRSGGTNNCGTRQFRRNGKGVSEKILKMEHFGADFQKKPCTPSLCMIIRR